MDEEIKFPKEIETPQGYSSEQRYPSEDEVIHPPYTPEEEITNIVGQIDPARILDNLNHSLKGEYYNKEKGEWESVGKDLVNEACRGWIISYFASIMNNASTMGIITEKQLSYLMEGVIKTVTREFKCNLEKFGFVPPGPGYEKGDYENKGTPDTSRMDSVAEIIYARAFIIYSRSLRGTESNKIFRSLSMSENLSQPGFQQSKESWIDKMFRRK